MGQSEEEVGGRALLPMFMVALAAFLIVIPLHLLPRDGASVVAVVYPPWVPTEQAFVLAAEAGGRVVRQGGWPGVFIVTPEDGGYGRRVRQGGALLLLDPGVMGGCTTEPVSPVLGASRTFIAGDVS